MEGSKDQPTGHHPYAVSEPELDLRRLDQLIRLVETRGLSELILEENGCRYAIRARGAPPSRRGSHDAHDVLMDVPIRHSERADPDAPDRSGWVAVVSPMVGVFYRSPGPGESPFVEVGDPVEEGQTIGIIEAMKVFSEIPSDHAGVVAEIVAADGQLVRADEPLLYLAPPSALDDEGDENE